MRRWFAIGLAATVVSFMTHSAAAEQVEIKGKYTAGQIKTACDNAGGSFSLDKNPGSAVVNGYSCTKNNCDGQGGQCIVACDAKTQQCGGQIPRLVPRMPDTPFGVLTMSSGRTSGPPGPGLLQPAPDGAPQGPTGPGTPKPTAPPAGKLY